MSDIIYTYTDEAPALATFSLYPMIKKFLSKANIDIQTVDISLAGRILANFSDYLDEDQKTKDYLQILGELTTHKDANIIKLPNISASVPQLNACIKELQEKGYKIPNYIENPTTQEEIKIKQKYAKVLGSAVNPVLREGNSDRRCAKAVKQYALKNPHKNKKWDESIKTEVSYMQSSDFYENEKSIIFENSTNLKVIFVDNIGQKTVLKENLNVLKNEIIDATFMSAKKLDEFIKNSIDLAKQKDLLYSVHLKATMMKVSDPVIFGHFVKEFFSDVFIEFKDEFKKLKVNENNGLKDLFLKIENSNIKDKIYAKFDEIYAKRPDLAYVDSDNKITNLHVPSDVIIDASMPAMIRNGGNMWDKNGQEKQTLAVIPDRSYALVYEAMIKDLKKNKELNPAKIGSVSNIGLMAKKAQEYGSHDKTFIMKDDGKIIVSDEQDKVYFEFDVENGDIFRMTSTKDEAIKNWINLAINRAKSTKINTIFWLDENRAHDRNLMKIVKNELNKLDINDLNLEILSPYEATLKTNSLIRESKDVITVTGNVLRDYLTDLYPIIELGTSAKMLSIVPLLNGGGLFETGAGGSAPKHAEQLIKENHLRWDSLGEFLALGASLEHLSESKNNQEAKILAKCLDKAISTWLKNDKSPKRKVGEFDNRNSHFYLILYFAKELANSNFGEIYRDIALNLEQNEMKINNEILNAQGKSVDLGGYYKFDNKKANEVMRPSKILNKIIDEF
ncbi:NADP-dependent isocitrate dehydrogenase [Campylobacter sp. FMV-PI01]|uniref:Isocitrate dehydrogenase [NADP] n=1 Tax=Campylobacter portucalensis TaxID=2608384 RepID=A0A6L5WJT3_9BACT|nr:NADP-dependent isocitrate dehydrogenase [Campylobacter portucalensis]MSN96285.1 NADP-dependent isocitrate dehydrogenase [Campylobacter portucalensis]